MVELGFGELSSEQIELLCEAAEESARKYVYSKVSRKDVERLDISVEAEGAKPVNVTVDIDLVLASKTKDVDAKTLVKQAVSEAHKATENFLRKLK
ncbi:MAG TPA: DUF3194 domain-containing protein [Candidatus Binatia bacterium]|nr:DUF3194 domain-containing protein [Candidatus Binatia bacterium]